MSDTWPYREAQKVLDRVRSRNNHVVTFQCGFGPSGSPHIGTVAEMLRTKMIIDAFNSISQNQYEVRWILFADDMDALRKVPQNVPNPRQMEQYIGWPICDIPDPWGRDSSFAEHNIVDLIEALCRFNITTCDFFLFRASMNYRNGVFNHGLQVFAKRANEIKDIVTHDYSPERRTSYCPFLPISRDGTILMNLYNWEIKDQPVRDYNYPEESNKAWPTVPMLYYRSEDDGEDLWVHNMLNGQCKLQWKADWPLRWFTHRVDYEMHGKDLIGSAHVGDKIMRLLGEEPPLHMMYELFLDEDGKKISKSVGDSSVLQQWADYTIPEVLMFFLGQNPRKARRMTFDMIPQLTDSYLKATGGSLINFSMLLNLVSITNTDDPNLIWSYIQSYSPESNPTDHPILDRLVSCAIKFYIDQVLATKNYYVLGDLERSVIADLSTSIDHINRDAPRDEIESLLTTAVYDVGKKHYGEDGLRNFFQMIYRVVMGQNSGPRLPIFIAIYGIDNTIKVLNEKIT